MNALCVTYMYDCLLAALEDFADDTIDCAKTVQAKGLYQQAKSFSFLVSLVTFDKVLFFLPNMSPTNFNVLIWT